MAETKSKKAITAEQKLRALYSLQLIDSRIDRIKTVRGELPLEVEDLEDEIQGLETRLGKLQEDVSHLEREISEKKNQITESKSLIKKYKEQQDNVRNNREFDSLNKELEFQGLEIQLAEKRIKEYKAQIDAKQVLVEEVQSELEGRRTDLETKKSELEEITNETQREEDLLREMAEKAAEDVEERLLKAYRRIRQGSKNGLGIVPIDREASAGSYIKIPPQRQLDVAARQKIIVDEHSGRILVDAELAAEEAEKFERNLEKLIKK